MITRRAPVRLIAAGRQYRLGRISDSMMSSIRRNGWREVASWNHEPTDDVVQQVSARDLQEQS